MNSRATRATWNHESGLAAFQNRWSRHGVEAAVAATESFIAGLTNDFDE
jgi:hypothetical protein